MNYTDWFLKITSKTTIWVWMKRTMTGNKDNKKFADGVIPDKTGYNNEGIQL